MKSVALLVFCLVAVVLAIPTPKQYYNPENVRVLKYENEIGTKKYRYSFEQSDGTQQEQEGKLSNEGSDVQFYVVKGRYSWVGPNGVKYTVHYVADKNGYHLEKEPQEERSIPVYPGTTKGVGQSAQQRQPVGSQYRSELSIYPLEFVEISLG